MKKITFLFMTLLTVIMVNAQFAYQTIKTDGFETSEGLPVAFTRTGQAAWSTATAPYTGGFWDLIFASATPKDYTVSATTTTSHSGTQSIKIATGTSNVALRLRTATGSPFSPSIVDWAKFKVTIWAKGTVGTQIFNAITTTATGDWDKYEFVNSYSTGTSESRLMFDLKPGTGTSFDVYLDDVIVEKYNQADPVTVAATAVSETGFTANWNTLVGASAYKLTLQTSTDGTVWTTVTDYPKTITGYATISEAITGLTNNTQYRYKIEGFDGTYYTPSSNFTTVTTSTTTALSKTSIQSIIVKNGILQFELFQAQSIEILGVNGQCLLKASAVAGQNMIPFKSKGIFVLKTGAENIKFANY